MGFKSFARPPAAADGWPAEVGVAAARPCAAPGVCVCVWVCVCVCVCVFLLYCGWPRHRLAQPLRCVYTCTRVSVVL